ncbi:ribonuclease HI [Actinophytocola sp. S1-96]|uniref:Ribonuclease H n=1 Tax=Actinophytocola gossypii TaxID=2812003 RepID=A0ABT2JK53_9PSEU|nr:ribonuclease HI [Actinophytocola gossypii]
MENAVEIHTDGACWGNPGPGGWGVVLRYGAHEKTLCGGVAEETTNNRMELTAPAEALVHLTRPAVVHLYTDSTYVRDGITKWVANWKRNGWLTTAKQPVKNADLWRRLDEAAARHDVEWHWVKGHAGNPDNERADQLALAGLEQALRDTGVDPATYRLPRRPAVPTTASTPRTCVATTNRGRPCANGARPSGLCHLHDPEVQCGAPIGLGARCTAPTGGELCQKHRRNPDGEQGLF